MSIHRSYFALIAAFWGFSGADAQSDPCGPIRQIGVECESTTVDLYSRSAQKGTYVRSEPIALRDDRVSAACCVEGAPQDARLFLAIALAEGDRLAIPYEQCLGADLGTRADIERSIVTDAEFDVLAGVEGDDMPPLLAEVRGKTGASATPKALCGADEAAPFWIDPAPLALHEGTTSFSDWRPAGRATILFLDIPGEER